MRQVPPGAWYHAPINKWLFFGGGCYSIYGNIIALPRSHLPHYENTPSGVGNKWSPILATWGPFWTIPEFPQIYPQFSIILELVAPQSTIQDCTGPSWLIGVQALFSYLWYPPHQMIRCRMHRQRWPLPVAVSAAEDTFADKLGSNLRHRRMRGSSALQSRHPCIQDAYPHLALKTRYKRAYKSGIAEIE